MAGLVVLCVGILGSVSSDDGEASSSEITSAAETTNELTLKSDEEKSTESTAETSETTQTTTQSMSLEEKNALSMAKQYLNYTAFSESGLIKQLEYEGFSTEIATFAAENCGADWNEQAAKMAEQYLNYTAFSRSGLIEQLEYEGFTKEQAEYGVSAVGY